ncbi:hypothetical protein [Streptomyces sp. NPDC059122]|uniref:hypothetical protein n=1 Tax=unclassified Streptomyces TaxID=2593676 RepID=UPI003677EB63
MVTGRRQEALERALSDLARQKRTEPDSPKHSFTKGADQPALFAAIRKDAQAKQLPVSHLAKRHHVNHATVRQALKSPTTLLLSGFFDAREQPDGLGMVFRDDQSWLTIQARYRFETAEPDQIS